MRSLEPPVRSADLVNGGSGTVVIVGAGLAGACTAAVLALDREVMVVDGCAPGGGASGAAAGLVNPFPGRRASPAWRHEEALDALEELSERAGLAPVDGQRGLLRPAHDLAQAEQFMARAEANGQELEWLSNGQVRERWTPVRAPLGALRVSRGYAIDLMLLVHRLLDGIALRNDTVVQSFGEDDSGAWVSTEQGERIEASTVILALGDGFSRLPGLRRLPLGRLKGETVRVRRPAGFPDIPPVASRGYVVPDGDSFVLGSTHERSFATDEPTAEGTREVLEKAARLVPGLAESPIVSVRAGVRVTVPGRISRRRLPRVGPLPGYRRVWLFIGLGSKGLLTAPLLARRLPEWMHRPETIPDEVSTVHLADLG